MKICTHCKQPIMPEVFLSPMKQKIFDIIKNNPGISTREIAGYFCIKAIPAIRQHIYQINQKLAARGISIVCGYGDGGRGRYRIVQHEGENNVGLPEIYGGLPGRRPRRGDGNAPVVR